MSKGRFEGIDTADLEAELTRRKKSEVIPPVKPLPLEPPDFTDLVRLITFNVETFASNGGRLDEDFDRYVYETAMEAVYGKDIWKWLQSYKEE